MLGSKRRYPLLIPISCDHWCQARFIWDRSGISHGRFRLKSFIHWDAPGEGGYPLDRHDRVIAVIGKAKATLATLRGWAFAITAITRDGGDHGDPFPRVILEG